MANRRTIRVPDDNGETRSGWAEMDGPALNVEDWHSLRVIDGPTGNSKKRPLKPFDELTERGKRLRRQVASLPEAERYHYGYVPSTRADWAKEKKEREEAARRVAEWKTRRG